MPFQSPWAPDDSLVLVVASCRGGYDQARRFGIYHCQNRRTVRPSRYIAFYSEGQIDTYAELDGPPELDVVIADRRDLAALAAEMPDSNGDPREPHSVFRLKAIRPVGPIINDMVGRNGKRVAWTQSRSYTRLADLKRAARTSQLPRG